jgi:hypothetical protein
MLKSFSQKMYACFENDKNKNLQLSVYFDENNKAKYVKYKGYKDVYQLTFLKTERTANEGGHPRYFIANTYVEKNKGVVTGTYTFTNAGTHGLDVTFIRKKDNKEFYFFIIEGSQDSDNAVYRTKPCFQ